MAELDLGMVRPALVDNLTSTRTDAALTANQGKALKDSIDSLNTVIDLSSSYTKGASVYNVHRFNLFRVGKLIVLEGAFNLLAVHNGDTIITITDPQGYPRVRTPFIGTSQSAEYIFSFEPDGKMITASDITSQESWVFFEAVAVAVD